MNALSASLIVLVLAGGLIQRNGGELPRFDEYRAEDSFEGPPAALTTGSSRLANAYRTRLREGAEAGPNFAGHFTLVAWGVGVRVRSGPSLMP
jgi:hypothetical protein